MTSPTTELVVVVASNVPREGLVGQCRVLFQELQKPSSSSGCCSHLWPLLPRPGQIPFVWTGTQSVDQLKLSEDIPGHSCLINALQQHPQTVYLKV